MEMTSESALHIPHLESLTDLYDVLSNQSIHYSNNLNKYRILVFSVCTLLLALAANIGFNASPNGSFSFDASATIETTATFGVILFTLLVNFSIHQLIEIIHRKYRLVESNMAELETAISAQGIPLHFAQDSAQLRSSHNSLSSTTKYSGTVWVIYIAAGGLALCKIVALLFLS